MKFDEILEEEYEDCDTLLEHPANEYDRHWNRKFGLWEYSHRTKLGLTPRNRKWVVHHKDGNIHNNSKWNLEKLTRAEHARVGKPALKHEKCKICGAKHFGKGYCAHHYWLYVTKKNKIK
jgi:hypothetical protein